jgi:hypothetical protein
MERKLKKEIDTIGVTVPTIDAGNDYFFTFDLPNFLSGKSRESDEDYAPGDSDSDSGSD